MWALDNRLKVSVKLSLIGPVQVLGTGARWFGGRNGQETRRPLFCGLLVTLCACNPIGF